MKRAAALILAFVAGHAHAQVIRYDGHRVARVSINSTKDLRTALALTDDVWTHTIRPGEPVDIRVSPGQFDALTQSGLRFEVLIDNVQAQIDAESAEIRRRNESDDPAWYTNYHTYAENKAYCQALAASFPGLCTYSVIGASLQGREIFALRITGPGSTANRPASLWFGGQHAREWINVPVPEYHAEQLLTRYATDAHIRYLVDHHEFHFVPIMNPDGVDYTWTNDRLWRKNRRPNTNNPAAGCSTTFGIDLNRNWGYQWGFDNSGSSPTCSSETYRGVGAFSEPETQVMRDFVIANPRIRTMMDWHSYGQLILTPWGYTATLPAPPAAAQLFQSLSQSMAAAILPVNNRVYTPGTFFTALYPGNGVSTDWGWGARGVYSFLIELPINNFVLPPDQIAPVCLETWPAFLVLANHFTPCYANCDGSSIAPVLTANDFQCFLNRFAAADSWANCDASTAAPTLTANDFQCFLNSFAQGCP